MQQSKVKIIQQQINILFIRTSPIKVVYSKHCNRRRQTPFSFRLITSPPTESGVLWWPCLSVCLFADPRSYFRNYTSDLHQIFLCMLPMVVARFFLGGVAIRYVLPVIRMPPYDVTQAKAARRRRPAEAQTTCSLGLGYKGRAMVAVVGQRTHVQTTVFI